MIKKLLKAPAVQWNNKFEQLSERAKDERIKAFYAAAYRHQKRL